MKNNVARKIARGCFVFLALSIFNGRFSTLVAQNNAISKQLEVSKAYAPKVGRAVKLPVEPNMVDTVRLRPESPYRITPTAWQARFESPKIAAAEVNATSYQRPRPLYLRAGLGYSPKSTFDLYWTPYMGDGSRFGLFVNHRGSWSKVRNDIGIKASALETLNGIGIFGSRKIGGPGWAGRRTFEGHLDYDNRIYQNYGSGDDLSDDDIRAIVPLMTRMEMPAFDYNRREDTYSLGRVAAGVSFGDGFTDLSRLNFRVGLRAGFSHIDRRESQADVDFYLRMARMFGGRHGVEVAVFERGAIDLSGAGMSAFALELVPRYLLGAGRFNLSAGFDARYIRNRMYGQHRFGIAPVVEAKWDVARGRFVPFVNLASHLVDGSYEALSRRNPYLHLGHAGPTGTRTDLRVGFDGNINDVFTYHIAGGVSWLRDYQIFVAEYDVALSVADTPGNYHALYSPVMFAPRGGRGRLYTAGAELKMLPVKGVSVALSGNFYKMSLRGDLPGDLPNFDAGLDISYSYRDRFTLSAGAKVLGRRVFLNEYDLIPPTGSSAQVVRRVERNSLRPVVNVTFSGEVRAAKDFWVFVEAGNLANQRLYDLNHYAGGGPGVTAGIKVVF